MTVRRDRVGGSGLSRRGLLKLPLAGLAVPVLAACAAEAPAAAGLWNEGQLSMATGNNTGVYYQVGAGYTDVISRHMRGYEAMSAPTTGSIDNILRVSDHDVDIAIALIDMCADAIKGAGEFSSPQNFSAIAQLYLNYMQVFVRTDRNIRSLTDLRGKRISTGSPKSGSETLAIRMLSAVGIDADRDCLRTRSSLQRGTEDMLADRVDAVFWTGGLPTLGIKDLFAKMPGKVAMLGLESVLQPLKQSYSDVYRLGTLAKTVYGDSRDVQTLNIPNLMLVRSDMPDDLAYELTSVIFTYTKELAKAHPEWKNVSRDLAPQTDPVPLHPGARRYYREH